MKHAIAVIVNTSTFVDWQIICSTPKNMDRSGIKNVPPPIPIPAKIPEKQDTKSNKTTSKIPPKPQNFNGFLYFFKPVLRFFV